MDDGLPLRPFVGFCGLKNEVYKFFFLLILFSSTYSFQFNFQVFVMLFLVYFTEIK